MFHFWLFAWLASQSYLLGVSRLLDADAVRLLGAADPAAAAVEVGGRLWGDTYIECLLDTLRGEVWCWRTLGSADRVGKLPGSCI